jgi:energy-coupling factor transport system permease protein
MTLTTTTSRDDGVRYGLDPLTRLTISVGTLVAAALIDGIVCLLLLWLVAVVLPAVVAGVTRRVLATASLLALPLAVSVVLVNVLFPVGGTPLAELGPLQITSEGVVLAVGVLARVLTMAGAVVLFYVTTTPSGLVASLRFHGVPARATFVIHNGVAMIPRLASRARAVTEAQRARGLDTEGRPWRRVRGVVALAVPTVLGAVREVETRTLALETRGFTRPGHPTLLWKPSDSPRQRLLRWAIAAGLLVLLAARSMGVALPC